MAEPDVALPIHPAGELHRVEQPVEHPRGVDRPRTHPSTSAGLCRPSCWRDAPSGPARYRRARTVVDGEHRLPGLGLGKVVVREAAHDAEVGLDVVGPGLPLRDLLAADPQRLVGLVGPEHRSPVADDGRRRTTPAQGRARPAPRADPASARARSPAGRGNSSEDADDEHRLGIGEPVLLDVPDVDRPVLVAPRRLVGHLLLRPRGAFRLPQAVQRTVAGHDAPAGARGWRCRSGVHPPLDSGFCCRSRMALATASVAFVAGCLGAWERSSAQFRPAPERAVDGTVGGAYRAIVRTRQPSAWSRTTRAGAGTIRRSARRAGSGARSRTGPARWRAPSGRCGGRAPAELDRADVGDLAQRQAGDLGAQIDALPDRRG